jgi:hypothetical protein
MMLLIQFEYGMDERINRQHCKARGLLASITICP